MERHHTQKLPKSYVNLIRLNCPGVYYPDLGGYFVGVIDSRNTDPSGLSYLLILAAKNMGETGNEMGRNVEYRGGSFIPDEYRRRRYQWIRYRFQRRLSVSIF